MYLERQTFVVGSIVVGYESLSKFHWRLSMPADVLCKANVIEISFLSFFSIKATGFWLHHFNFTYFHFHSFFRHVFEIFVFCGLLKKNWKIFFSFISFHFNFNRYERNRIEERRKREKNSLKIDFHSFKPHNRNRGNILAKTSRDCSFWVKIALIYNPVTFVRISHRSSYQALSCCRNFLKSTKIKFCSIQNLLQPAECVLMDPSITITKGLNARFILFTFIHSRIVIWRS